MKIFGDLLSPFVRMAIVTAHETGLAGKFTQDSVRVAPTEANKDALGALAAGARSGAGDRPRPCDLRFARHHRVSLPCRRRQGAHPR